MIDRLMWCATLAVCSFAIGAQLQQQEGGGPADVSPSVEPTVQVQDVPPPPVAPPAEDLNTDGPSVEPGSDAVPTPSVAPVSLKQAIAAYRAAGGVRYYVRGKSDAAHLVEDHGWTYQQIAGLSYDELQFLHGASHTGKISPSDYGTVCSTRPVVTVYTTRGNWCAACNLVKGWKDDDDLPFDVSVVYDEGKPWLPYIEWKDRNGYRKWFGSQYTPSKRNVVSSWRQTQ